MTDYATPTNDGETLTVRGPLVLNKRRGRKLVVSPEGTRAWALPRSRVDNAMVKALARAHRWTRMLESGEFATIEDLAAAEKINPSYLSRVLRLTLLAADIVETILYGRQPPELQLDALLKPFPTRWEDQNRLVSVFPR